MSVPKNRGIDNTLYLKADNISSSKIDIKPLVIPQPKQLTLKKCLTGQRETEKSFVKI